MTSPAVTVGSDTTLRTVADLLNERRISGVPVVDDGRLVGLVSEADMLGQNEAELRAGRVSDVMTRDVIAVGPDTPVAEVAQLLETRRIKRVPVVREREVLGVVSRSNLVQAIAVQAALGQTTADDGVIRKALLAALQREPWWSPLEASVIVTDGVVHYWGRVQGEDQRRAAHRIALRIPDVRRVDDHRLLTREASEARARQATAVRRAAERGHSKHAGIESYHSFSFGNYYDAAHTGYGPLRVLNEKRVQPGQGFTTYGVRDVEIVTYVLEGGLGYEDSLDNEATLSAGGVQCLSAGSGMRFSERCGPGGESCRFLQMWIDPDRLGLAASYEQAHFPPEEKRGRLRLIASPDAREGSLRVHQDVRIHAGLFDRSEHAQLALPQGRRCYVHVARGAVVVNGEALGEGDALKTDSERLVFANGRGAEVLVFDVPGERRSSR